MSEHKSQSPNISTDALDFTVQGLYPGHAPIFPAPSSDCRGSLRLRCWLLDLGPDCTLALYFSPFEDDTSLYRSTHQYWHLMAPEKCMVEKQAVYILIKCSLVWKKLNKICLFRWQLGNWTKIENDVFCFTDLENDNEILNRINELNTTKFLLDTAHQKQDLIHKFEFFAFFFNHKLSFNLITNVVLFRFCC